MSAPSRAERNVRWSSEPEMEAWMLEHDHGQPIDELSDEFAKEWGFQLARPQVSLFRSSHGTQSRRGRGGGRRPVPVGSERASKDGYIVVKVAEHAKVSQSKDNWRFKHWVAWEQANGREVPEDDEFDEYRIEEFELEVESGQLGEPCHYVPEAKQVAFDENDEEIETGEAHADGCDYSCSRCGYTMMGGETGWFEETKGKYGGWEYKPRFKYCPNCGARVERDA